MAKSDLFVARKRPTIEDKIPREKFISVKRVKYNIKQLESSVRSPNKRELLLFETANNPGKVDWDRAHDVYEDCLKKGMIVDFVEPARMNKTYVDNFREIKSQKNQAGYVKNWPIPNNVEDVFVWNLGDEYTQLAKAREYVQNNVIDKYIRIAHIDTGYHPTHPSTPENIQWKLGKSFIKGEDKNPGIDDKRNTFQEQQGHGCATLAILAGNYLEKRQTDGNYEGWFGAVPFAEVVPIRICDTVALFHTKALVEAVEYAIETGCEIITISMAGTPSRAWAKVINKAYEKGITIVAAAGNSWVKGGKKLLPKSLLYPARFDRVIAACGVTFNQEPYVFEANSWNGENLEGDFMQGNFGPKNKMDSALAAYTPNISWATKNQKAAFTFSGGGTSAATPQIAAAAALWILANRSFLKERAYAGNWKQVEAVRHALFATAKKDEQYKAYYGNGVLQAYQALFVRAEELDLIKSKKASVNLLGIGKSLGLFLPVKGADLDLVDPVTKEMMSLEIYQLMHDLPELHQYLEVDWDQNQKVDELTNEDISAIYNCILASNKASNHLKRRIRQVRLSD